MPAIVEYDAVIERMSHQRLGCQYYNSGAFGFGAAVTTHYAGWIGRNDPTIRPAALAHAHQIAAPYEATLARLATQFWQMHLPGPVWVMPKANWAYELDFGSKAWLPAALRQAGVDPAALGGRTNSPAIEFCPDEAKSFTPLLQALLGNLLGSDFALAFPDWPVACTVHHHKQIWWISSDEALMQRVAESSTNERE